MSSDKLNRTVRAAGFAMACDETLGAPIAKPAPPAPLALAKPDTKVETPQSQPGFLTTLRTSKPLLGFAFTGWSIGKTA
jgi:hypothetical protein